MFAFACFPPAKFTTVSRTLLQSFNSTLTGKDENSFMNSTWRRNLEHISETYLKIAFVVLFCFVSFCEFGRSWSEEKLFGEYPQKETISLLRMENDILQSSNPYNWQNLP